MSFATNDYIALPPVGYVSAAIVLFKLRSIYSATSQKDKPWAYSKFSKGFEMKSKIYVSGNLGCAITYGIPFLSALGHLMYTLKYKKPEYINQIENKQLSQVDWHTILPNLMIITHFGKRIFESLFVHIFSNRVLLRGGVTIGGYYTFLSMTSLYYQSMVDRSYYEDSKVSMMIGGVLFGIGEFGNLVHHYLLRKNRLDSEKGNDHEEEENSSKKTKKKKKYVIPQGGLFGLVWAPHYFFELVAWYGIAVTSKHLNYWLMAGCYTSYLVGRAMATKSWYEKEFEGNCPDRNAIVPFVV